MSVVGPRPPMPREVAQYDASQLVRLKGKPGITGLWQVSGRKSLSFDDMVRLDSYYLEHWSLRLDLSIMLRTFSAVLTRRGAY
jgi:lipopolysaccharide/colanic/teichoic acid biosynthesis glycosyltransferase